MKLNFMKPYLPKTDKEKDVFELIKRLCDSEKADIKISSAIYYINHEDLHYSIIISGKSVVIVNSEFTFRETFGDKFVEALCKIIDERATKDINKIISNIETRESSMLKNAIGKISEEVGVVENQTLRTFDENPHVTIL